MLLDAPRHLSLPCWLVWSWAVGHVFFILNYLVVVGLTWEKRAWPLLWWLPSCNFGIGCAFLLAQVWLQWKLHLESKGPVSQEGSTRLSEPHTAWGEQHPHGQAFFLTRLLMFGKRSVPDGHLAWKIPPGDEQSFLSPWFINNRFWWHPLWLPGMATYPLLPGTCSLLSWPGNKMCMETYQQPLLSWLGCLKWEWLNG